MGTAAGCRRSGVCHIHSPVAAVGEVTWVLSAWAAVGYLQQERSKLSDAGQPGTAVAALGCGKIIKFRRNLKVGCSLLGLDRARRQVLPAGLALCAAGTAAPGRACMSDLDHCTERLYGVVEGGAMHGGTNSNAPMGHMRLVAPLASHLL